MTDEREEALRLGKESSLLSPWISDLDNVLVKSCATLIRLARQSTPCPHLRSSSEGTQYCALAQSGAQGEAVTATGHEDAIKQIDQCMKRIEILCDGMGYDPSEFLADAGLERSDASPHTQPDDVRDALQVLPGAWGTLRANLKNAENLEIFEQALFTFLDHLAFLQAAQKEKP